MREVLTIDVRRLDPHAALAVHRRRLLARTDQRGASRDSRGEDGVAQAPQRRVLNDATVAVLTSERATGEVLTIAVLGEPQLLVVQRVHHETVRLEARGERDLRARAEHRISEIRVVRSGLSLDTLAVEQAEHVEARSVATQKLIFLEHQQLVQQAVVDLRDEEGEILGHLVRDLDPARDLAQGLSHRLVVRERQTRLLGVLTDESEVAPRRGVKVVLDEVGDRRRRERARTEPVSDGRSFLVGVDDAGVDLRLEKARPGGRHLVSVTRSLQATRELRRIHREPGALALGEGLAQGLDRVLTERASSGAATLTSLIGGLAEGLENARGLLRHRDALVEFRDLGALGDDELVLIRREVAGLGLGLLGHVANLSDKLEALFLEGRHVMPLP